MKTEDIKTLVQAFYQGETTIGEEQILIRYFENENVPEELAEEKELFLQLYQSGPVEIPENLESKLSTLIDGLAEKEEKKFSPKTRQLWMWISGAAACIIILIASGIILNWQPGENANPLVQQNHQKGMDITDPERIAIETQKALILVSRNFNKSEEQLAFASANLGKANQLLKKQIKSINSHRKNIRHQKNENQPDTNSI
ncbi:hypothetical protein FACS1894174_09770 [Bacteroidia bacterium]|nr:hypothetical protein FACS1894203_4450 [Bacteroidia bacterium]GHT71620.1 hypothetical protein FACS189455_3860 [Bacteroidia bacterium]GHV23703.1 hypothetical protein FACS1894174_09770 [Bacteroidia bacterium]